MTDISEYETAFETLIADSTQNNVALRSSDPLNSERWRLQTSGTVSDVGTPTDGSRLDANPNVSDTRSVYELSTNGNSGDVIALETHERPRYVPGYEALWGIKANVQSELTNHKLRVEFAAEGEGFGYEHAPDYRAVYVRKDGSRSLEKRSDEWDNDPFQNTLSEVNPILYRCFFNWYGVGPAEFTVSYTNDRERQNNDLLASLADKDNLLTNDANLRLRVELECIADGDAATVESGSAQHQTRGDIDATVRTKASNEFGLDGGTQTIDDTGYTPIKAIRLNPDIVHIYTELNRTNITPTDKMELVILAVHKSETDATNWNAVSVSSEENDNVQETTDVTTFPTEGDGSLKGRQMDIVTSLGQSGQGSNVTLNSEGQDVKEPIYDDDVILFLAKQASGTGASTDLLYRTLQEW